MITPTDARSIAVSFVTNLGLDRSFVEHVSVTTSDVESLLAISKRQQPRRVLEIGTFVGVSTSVLAQCLPNSFIVSVDPNYPVAIQSVLGSVRYSVSDQRTSFTFVKALLDYLGVSDRVCLHEGFFSGAPTSTTQNILTEHGFSSDMVKVLGPVICRDYGGFDMAFIDGDHSASSVVADLRLLWPSMSDGGIVVLHDCGPGDWSCGVHAGIEQFRAEQPCSFRILGDLGVLTVSLQDRGMV